jgi:hypothetical protein
MSRRERIAAAALLPDPVDHGLRASLRLLVADAGVHVRAPVGRALLLEVAADRASQQASDITRVTLLGFRPSSPRDVVYGCV